MTIGKLIQKARKEMKISQKELGKRMGISGAMVAQYENDLRKPKPETVERFSSALGIVLCENSNRVKADESKDENSMLCMDFHRAMKEHCIRMNAECENCCMRLYCYTPPCEKTDSMMANVISFLATAQSRTGNENHSDHCTGAVQMPCPCNMDMSTALGYEPRQ